MADPVEPLRQAIDAGHCPDCSSDQFFKGPRGGICTNIECAGCGSKFNVAAYEGEILLVDRIGPPAIRKLDS